MKLTEFRKLIREEVSRALSEADPTLNNTKELDKIVDMFSDLVEGNSMQEAQHLAEGVYWTPATSEALISLGAKIGLGPIASHIVLFGGVILAVFQPYLKDEYKSFLQYLKGRKLANPVEMKKFKDEILSQSSKLTGGRKANITRTLNDIVKYAKNKEYKRAAEVSQRLARRLRLDKNK